MKKEYELFPSVSVKVNRTSELKKCHHSVFLFLKSWPWFLHFPLLEKSTSQGLLVLVCSVTECHLQILILKTPLICEGELQVGLVFKTDDSLLLFRNSS